MNRWLIHDIKIKILSVVLALIIWLYFFAAREGVFFTVGKIKKMDVIVEVLGLPLSTSSVKVVPNYIEVTVKGPGRIISVISPEDMKVFVEVKGLGKGRYDLPVRVYAGNRINIISKNPQTVTAIINSTPLIK